MNLLFLGTALDKPYLHNLKPIIGAGNPCKVILERATTLTEITHYCKIHNITGVICTQAQLIPKLTGEDYGDKIPALDNYAGSLLKKDNIEFVFVHPLAHCITVPYGNFLLHRYISKLTTPDSWYISTVFSWEIANEANIKDLYERFKESPLLAIDIETKQEPLSITCVGYCALFISATGHLSSHSIVIPLTSEFFLHWIDKFNCLSGAKVLQNGKYDIAYLSRYGVAPTEYYFDTKIAMHCWFAELPKDLGFINSFMVRDARYWKHEAAASNMEQYYLYNAKDTHNTLNAFIAWLIHAPKYAKDNYVMEFPLIYPCHVAEMTGLKRDFIRQDQQVIKINARITDRKKQLELMTVPNFNANSHVQVKQLMTALGCADLATSSDEAHLKNAMFRHPLNERILYEILEIRGDRKLVSTYFGKEFGGRILYDINPDGTDTGRCASTEHHFWCGLQLQNIPRGDEVKCTLIADDDFLLGEADYAQAESRDTAYITGDISLINAVEGERDFHSVNASAFFGVPYESIYDDSTGKTKDKKLRDLAKRTNHGANYCMGAAVMLETMGLDKVNEAQRLLGLNKQLTPKQVCEHLLDSFAKTYPKVANDYPAWVTTQVLATKKLIGATGWTRYCFKNPRDDKRARNAYVAHNPQSLNAMTLNKAFMKVFNEIWLSNSNNFKLHGQIHDSILFSYRIGYEHLAQQVKECMEMDIPVKDINGVSRVLRVPVDLKINLKRWSGE